jgi:hypothetical protein
MLLVQKAQTGIFIELALTTNVRFFSGGVLLGLEDHRKGVIILFSHLAS